MGKNKKRKRQKHSLLAASNNSNGTAVGFEEDGDADADAERVQVQVQVVVSDAALETTIATLQLIAQGTSDTGTGTGTGTSTSSGADTISMLHEKRFKALRRALSPFVLHQLKSYDHGTDYRVKVTQALQNHKWTDAVAGLQGCRDFQQLPKQGTIQRWVRDCDLAPDSCKLMLLNAILVVGNQAQLPSQSHESHQSDNNNRHDPRTALAQHMQQQKGTTQSDFSSFSTQNQGLEVLEPWSLGRLMTDDYNKDDEILPTGTTNVALESRILYQEQAAERTPPNHYDLLLHSTTPGSIHWDDDTSNERTRIMKHDVPFLSEQKGSAFLLENVLTVHECQQLRAAATSLGYRPDHPTAMDKPTGIDSCEWMVDDSILSVINQRVRPFLVGDATATTTSTKHHPHGNENGRDEHDTSNDKRTTVFHSINPRWRFFRYGQGCVYRPHIDGSWPASRISKDGQYESYSEDTEMGATIKSFHTFLIYLNDNFEGGQTRFYFPHGNSLAAQGVTPKCGSVLVFSQGNTASLLHEGSAVTMGTKYVVRTDVLYRTNTSKPMCHT